MVLPAESSRSLRARLLQLLAGAYALAFMLLFLNNLVEFPNMLSYMLGFWLLVMAALGLAFISLGYGLSVRALRPLLRWLDKPGDADDVMSGEARRAALAYPWRALAFCALFGLLAPVVFHTISVIQYFGDLQLANLELWESVVPRYLNEFSLSIGIGTAYAAASRRYLRPFLQTLPPPRTRDIRFVSIRCLILIITCSVSLTTGLPMLAMQLHRHLTGRPVSTWQLSALLAIGVGIGVLIGSILGGDIAEDLRIVSSGLTSLTSGRGAWRRALSMTSADEVGDLALAFNAVRARAMADSEEIEAELELARRIQGELLPKGPVHVRDWTVQGASFPSREVGGDFYDIAVLPDGRFVVAVGDASGKGMPAALLMAAALSMFRANVSALTTPGELLARLNGLLCETLPAGSFITMVCAVFSPDRSECTLSSAGHVDPLLLSPGEAGEYLELAALPLGLVSDHHFTDHAVRLAPGQRLMLYSDGLPEARDSSRAFYGFPRLAETATRLGGRFSASELVLAICEDVRSFAPGRDQDDDLTAVIIEAPHEAGGRLE